MFRTIKNLILLVILCITATGIPVYANFVFNFIISEDYVNYNVNFISHTADTHEAEIIFSSQYNSIPLEFISDTPLEFKIFTSNYIELKDLELEIFEKTKNPLTFSFIITPESLNLPNGDYIIRVAPNIKNISSPTDLIEIKFSLNRNVSYIRSAQSISQNRTALNLYFPNNELNHLIPITRIIPYTNTPLRSTINELYTGPNSSLGLPSDSPIPSIDNLSLNNNIASVFLPKDLGVYNDYSLNARNALDSFIKSLTSISEVSAVQFYIDRKIVPESFHGISIDKPIYKNTLPKLFVGYRTDTNRILLLPIETNYRGLDVNKIFDDLRLSTNTELYNSRVFPPIPEDIKLVSYSLTNNNLSLVLNESFVKYLDSEKGMNHFIIEALLYTYTSFPEIDSIILSIEGNKAINNSMLNKALKPSGFINVE